MANNGAAAINLSPLERLPPELVYRIGGFLSFIDRTNLSLTSGHLALAASQEDLGTAAQWLRRRGYGVCRCGICRGGPPPANAHVRGILCRMPHPHGIFCFYCGADMYATFQRHYPDPYWTAPPPQIALQQAAPQLAATPQQAAPQTQSAPQTQAPPQTQRILQTQQRLDCCMLPLMY